LKVETYVRNTGTEGPPSSAGVLSPGGRADAGTEMPGDAPRAAPNDQEFNQLRRI
jgi:hypothetical protein